MGLSNPFQGQRIVLRAFEPDDADAVHSLLNHPELAGRRYLPDEFPDTTPVSTGQVRALIEKSGGGGRALNLAVASEADGALLGYASLDWWWEPLAPSLHVVIDPQHWRQGYGSECAHLLIQFAFDTLPARAVAGGCASWNEPAREFARRLGFTETGAARRAGLRRGQPFDWVRFDMLRREWEGSNNAAGR